MSGEVAGRVDLVTPPGDVPIAVTVCNNNYRILAQVKDFELNTSRDAVDITALSQEFKHQYSD